MGLFNKKPMGYATLTLNARLQPSEREEYYEKGIKKALKKTNLGVIDGGGTLFSEKEGQLNCDITVKYYADKKSKIIELFKLLPAPIGSKLVFDGSDEEYQLGNIEGMAVYLNGTELDSEVYATCDVNFVALELSKRIGEDFAFFSSWQGSKQTALYFYGSNFEKMKADTADFIESYPLCQKCTIERIA